MDSQRGYMFPNPCPGCSWHVPWFTRALRKDLRHAARNAYRATLVRVPHQMRTDRQESLRTLSQSVFGQEHLLPLSIALMAARRPLTLSDLVEAVGVNNGSSLRAPLRRLLAGGFVERVPPAAPSDRSRPYTARKDSAFWALVVELNQRVEAQDPIF